MLDLRPPFLFNVVKRDGADDGETSEEDVSLWVRERSQSVIVFLASSVPEV